MATLTPLENGPARRDDTLPSGRVHLTVLALITAGLLFLCFRLAVPFLPALTWAFALAVLADPLHRRISNWITNANAAAASSVVLVITFILVPTVLVADRLGAEARIASDVVQEQVAEGQWRATVLTVPWIGDLLRWLEQHVDVEHQVREMVSTPAQDVAGLLQGSVWAALQFLLAVFVLFYFFRDRETLLRGVRSFSPLSTVEQDYVSTRVGDAIHATVYGTFITALVQAVSGGLLFWFVGLPAPVLWGVVMFVLGVLPFVGAVLVWLPAAIHLLLNEQVGAALLLLAWGSLMAGPVGNYLYGIFAAGRMRLHPVPTLIAYVGGLATFGITGMVLGPVVLALTLAAIDVWKRRSVPTPSAAPPEEVLVAR